jgi:hypothetical protein
MGQAEIIFPRTSENSFVVADGSGSAVQVVYGLGPLEFWDAGSDFHSCHDICPRSLCSAVLCGYRLRDGRVPRQRKPRKCLKYLYFQKLILIWN